MNFDLDDLDFSTEDLTKIVSILVECDSCVSLSSEVSPHPAGADMGRQ